MCGLPPESYVMIQGMDATEVRALIDAGERYEVEFKAESRSAS